MKIYKSKVPAPFLRLLSEAMPFPFVDEGEDSGLAHGKRERGREGERDGSSIWHRQN